MRAWGILVFSVVAVLLWSGSALGVYVNGEGMFTANAGQWPDSILFRYEGPDGVMWITSTARYYQLFREIKPDGRQPLGNLTNSPYDSPTGSPRIYTRLAAAKLANANSSASARAEEKSAFPTHYYLGEDQTTWRKGVSNYSALTIENIYPGIDCRYYFHDGHLEYDFMVAPGADAEEIRLQYQGIEEIRLDADGNLNLGTSWGMIIERAPVAYQEVEGERRAVAATYRVEGDRTVSLEIGERDESVETVIDPVLVGAAYVGGSDWEGDTRLAVDSAGNVFLLGASHSLDFPEVDAGDSLLAPEHAVVVALDPTLEQIRYVLCFGTGEDIYPGAVSLAPDGSVWVSGSIRAGEIPLSNAFDAVRTGGEGWLAHFSAEGDSLLLSSYLGGSGWEFVCMVRVSPDGQVLVTGDTDSPDFPGLPLFLNRGADAYLLQLNASGTEIERVKDFHGSDGDYGNDLAFGNDGVVFVTGRTSSADFPTTGEFAFPRIDSANMDVFVTKLDAAWNTVYSVCFGSAFSDGVNSIAVDAQGRASVTGFMFPETMTTDYRFPLVNEYQGNIAAGQLAFVSALNAAGDSLEFSTLLGGYDYQNGVGIGVAPSGDLWVSGSTTSPDFPVVNPLMSWRPVGYMAFLTSFVRSGEVPFSTLFAYWPTEGLNYGLFLDFDGSGHLYFCGYSSPVGIQTSPRNTDYSTSCEMWVAKFLIDGSCCYGMRGEIDGRSNPLSLGPNVSDLTYLINFIFRGGAAPACFEEADLHLSTPATIDIHDLVYLVDYLFRYGPAPGPCQGFE